MNESQLKILCIDDDNDTCELVTFVLESEGYKVVSCSSAEEGLLEARKDTFKAIVLDNRFAKTSGIEICKEIRSFNTTIPIIFLSGEARPKEISKALESGADAYLVKPNDFEKLTETVTSLIQDKQTMSA